MALFESKYERKFKIWLFCLVDPPSPKQFHTSVFSTGVKIESLDWVTKWMLNCNSHPKLFCSSRWGVWRFQFHCDRRRAHVSPLPICCDSQAANHHHGNAGGTHGISRYGPDILQTQTLQPNNDRSFFNQCIYNGFFFY